MISRNTIWFLTTDPEVYQPTILKLKNFSISTEIYSRPTDILKALTNELPSALVIDYTLDNPAAFEYCYSIKSNPVYRKIKIFMVSDTLSEHAEVQAFDSGADDFIRKPFYPEAFTKRVINRIQVPELKSIQFESNYNGQSKLYIDRESFTVFLNQQPISISKKEFELLHLMASSPGKIFTRDEIFEKIWKRKSGLNDRTIDVHILRLRKKLGDQFISTQKGVGYRFELGLNQ